MMRSQVPVGMVTRDCWMEARFACAPSYRVLFFEARAWTLLVIAICVQAENMRREARQAAAAE